MLTNLGDVPKGMTFLEATKNLELKYRINPQNHTKRLTICETMREVWRIADQLQNDDLKALAAAGFHYGKAMNNRMIELRGYLDDCNGWPEAQLSGN